VVLVESEVANQNKLFPRWIECLHHKMYDKRDDLVWTEGFSCRKELAIKAGLFPYVNRNSAGEDAIFGENLEKIGAKKIIDRTIRVRHYAPEDIKTFWNQRKGRSRGTIFVMKFYFKQKNAKILLTAFPRLLFNLIYSLTLIMPLLEAFILAKYSFRKYRDILPFFLVNQINSFASFFGKIEALWLILNADS
jgi:cellulose synthase/poly-beta-1,6-N-acetylglucosamine synthase-like glycosyltransferase